MVGRWQAGRVDRELAAGVSPWASGAHALRAPTSGNESGAIVRPMMPTRVADIQGLVWPIARSRTTMECHDDRSSGGLVARSARGHAKAKVVSATAEAPGRGIEGPAVRSLSPWLSALPRISEHVVRASGQSDSSPASARSVGS
jgi:hypothetical protein